MVTHRSGGAVTIPRMSGDTTGASPAPGLSARWIRAAAILVFLSLLGAVAQAAWRRAHDPLAPARWIGLWEAAEKALPAEVAFVLEFDLAEAMTHPVLEAEGDEGWSVELDGRVLATGRGSGARRFDLPGPLPQGRHLLVAVASHPAGVASVRLRLRDASGRGKSVVTGRGWGADDDAPRVRDRGRKGARYWAMVWGRPPLSSWSASSVTRSWTGNGGSSIDAESSRIPSRADAQ